MSYLTTASTSVTTVSVSSKISISNGDFGVLFLKVYNVLTMTNIRWTSTSDVSITKSYGLI